MMPNIDPRTLKNMMSKMGIKSEEVKSHKVIIECEDKDIVIDMPQITKIEMQGITSFQITGDIHEEGKEIEINISNEDIELVMEKTGINDKEKIEQALEKYNGDIAAAILSLTTDNNK